jgi:hypothetical protein
MIDAASRPMDLHAWTWSFTFPTNLATRLGTAADLPRKALEAIALEEFRSGRLTEFRMEQQGLTRRDLENIIGTRTRIAEVLNRKRGLSIAMIRRLHQRLGISAEVLIRPSRNIVA